MNNAIIKFVNGDLELDVTVSPDKDTVWLSANQMALLFNRDEKTIRKHINNTFKDQEVEKENNTQKMRVVGVKQSVPFYSLDVIISVGYRVKSLRGTQFRIWATGILKEYMQQVSIIIRRHRNQSGFLRLFKINCILQLTDIQLQKLYMSVLMQKNCLWD